MLKKLLFLILIMVFIPTCSSGDSGPKAPEVADIAITTNEDQSINFTVSVANNSANAAAMTYTISKDPNNGEAVLNGASGTYTPNENFNGADSFQISVANGDLVTTANVSVTINSVNDAPEAINQYITTNENKFSKLTINLEAIDVEDDNLTFSLVGNVVNGQLEGSGKIYTYTPDQDWHGSDGFTFKANDGQLDSNIASVVIGVNPTNDSPTTSSISMETAEDTPLTFMLIFNDIDNDNLTFEIVQGAQNGSVSLSDQFVTYTPNLNYNGIDTFTFKANDGTVDSNISTASINVISINDAPTSENKTVNGTEDQSVEFSVNANDVEGETLSYHLVSGPSNGSVAINPSSNEMIYTPLKNYFGQDSFNYRVKDGTLFSSNSSVLINISGVDDPTIVNDGSKVLDEDIVLTFDLPVENIDNDPIVTTITNSPSNGTLSILNGINVIYSPNENYFGSDSFNYTVNDGTENSDEKTINLTINSVEDIPQFSTDVDSVFFGSSLYSQSYIALSIDDQDADGDAISWSISNVSGNWDIIADSLYISRDYLSGSITNFETNLLGVDSNGNSNNFNVNITYIGGPEGLWNIVEMEHNWAHTSTVVDCNNNSQCRNDAVSIVKNGQDFASNGTTGFIVENRTNTWGQGSYTRDFDRFDFWTKYASHDVELDFSKTSLAWSYIDEQIFGVVPFAAYAIDNLSGERTRLYIGIYEGNTGADGVWNIDDGEFPSDADVTYSSDYYEPIYLYWPEDINNSYDPANDAQYIADNDLITSGGCGWGNSNNECLVSTYFNDQTINYPFATGILIGKYLGDAELPTEQGHQNFGSGFSSASSIVFDTWLNTNPSKLSSKNTNNINDAIEELFGEIEK